MKRNLLSRLRVNGLYYLVGALLIVVIIPLFQVFILNPLGYARSLDSAQLAGYIAWVGSHTLPFVIYRFLLTLAFALLLTLPFALFRIIVAQEIVAQQEQEEDRVEEIDEGDEEEAEEVDLLAEATGMPSHAWRGKGFAVIAAWAGLAGLVIYILGTAAGTLYLVLISNSQGSTAQGSATTLTSIFSVTTNTVAIGLIALSTLFFGAMIARSGLRLWPGIWVAFAYMAIATTALLSGSAVALASAPLDQSPLTTPAILVFALWVFWFGVMLIRLQPEPVSGQEN